MATEENTTPCKCGLCETSITDACDSMPALFVGRICRKCEDSFKRTKASQEATDSKEFLAYEKKILKGTIKAPFTSRIIFVDGFVIESPVSVQTGKRFVKATNN